MRITLARTLKQRALSELSYLHELWAGSSAPQGRQACVTSLVDRMQEGAAAATVRANLDPTADAVLRAVAESPRAKRRETSPLWEKRHALDRRGTGLGERVGFSWPQSASALSLPAPRQRLVRRRDV